MSIILLWFYPCLSQLDHLFVDVFYLLSSDGPCQYHIRYTSLSSAIINFNNFIINIKIMIVLLFENKFFLNFDFYLIIFIYGNLLLSIVAESCRATCVLITFILKVLCGYTIDLNTCLSHSSYFSLSMESIFLTFAAFFFLLSLQSLLDLKLRV